MGIKIKTKKLTNTDKGGKMRKGFTLIELIIVIIIVGILAAVGMSQYTKVVEKGRAAEARLILGSLRSAQVAMKIENDNYATVPNLGVSAPTAVTATHYFTYACDTAGVCTATRITSAGKTPQGPSAYTKTLNANGTWGGDGGY